MMANNIIFYLVFVKLVIVAIAGTLNTSLNKTCIDGNDIILQIGVYKDSCPEAEIIIYSWVEAAIFEDPRMAASLLRLHFHDCFVNGCDASVLLDDTDSFVGEKTAAPNLNSLRGFEVIDNIKSDLELVCPDVVSCADILAIAARDSVLLSGGPRWEVPVGRTDSLTASQSAANNNIPAPNSNVATLVAKFQNVGLTLEDMVALSGAHTIGKARCSSFRSRLKSAAANTNRAETNMDFLQSLQQLCPDPNNNITLAHLDLVTPATFDNQYYVNLLSGEGLLTSDQVLMTGNDRTRAIVQSYVDDQEVFFDDFKNSMLRMGNLASGNNGEIRRNCRFVN